MDIESNVYGEGMELEKLVTGKWDFKVFFVTGEEKVHLRFGAVKLGGVSTVSLHGNYEGTSLSLSSS